jgi:hypothetical protein
MVAVALKLLAEWMIRRNSYYEGSSDALMCGELQGGLTDHDFSAKAADEFMATKRARRIGQISSYILCFCQQYFDENGVQDDSEK